MGQQKYTNDNIIWRNRVPYAATSRNLRRSRKSFLKEQGEDKPYYSRHRKTRRMTKEEKEFINSINRAILFSIIWVICSLFILVWLFVLSIIFILEFMTKSIFLSIRKIKDKKVNIFKINESEMKIGRLMKDSIFWLGKFHLSPKKSKKK